MNEQIKKISSRIHPLAAGAAVSVILVSLLGVAAITGRLPGAHGTAPESVNTTASAPAVVPAVVPLSTPTTTPNGAQPAVDGTLPPPKVAEAEAPCPNCGTVESVRAIRHQAQPSGVGAVAGALLGGVIGNRFGGGNGRALTTVVGAVGGGLAGNEVEKRSHSSITYQVRVKMENGKVRTFPYSAQPDWNAGDRVKVVEGTLTALK
ncbi:MAG: glycine zipper 2TM domain-containing protein [Burkholderiales bacterium]